MNSHRLSFSYQVTFHDMRQRRPIDRIPSKLNPISSKQRFCSLHSFYGARVKRSGNVSDSSIFCLLLYEQTKQLCFMTPRLKPYGLDQTENAISPYRSLPANRNELTTAIKFAELSLLRLYNIDVYDAEGKHIQ